MRSLLIERLQMTRTVRNEPPSGFFLVLMRVLGHRLRHLRGECLLPSV
jgi:hypothetical protein